MQHRRLYAVICLLTSVFSLDFTACSSMRGAPHDLSDPARHDPLAEDYWRLNRVNLGAVLTITTRDSGTVVGHYDGFDQEPAEEYAARYQAWLADSSAPTPRFTIGSKVRVERRNAAPEDAVFRGFDFGVLRYLRGGESKERVAEFTAIGRLADSTGSAVSGDTLTLWLTAGRLPLGSRLRLTDHRKTRRLPLEQIVQLKAHGIPVGVKIAIVAGFVAILIVAYANRPAKRQTQPTSSCQGNPDVYVLGPGASR